MSLPVTYFICDEEGQNRGPIMAAMICFGSMKYDTKIYPNGLKKPWIAYEPNTAWALDTIKHFRDNCPFFAAMSKIQPIAGKGKKEYILIRGDQERAAILWGLQCARFPVDKSIKNNDIYHDLLKEDIHPIIAMWVSRYVIVQPDLARINKIRVAVSQGQHSPVPNYGNNLVSLSLWIKRALNSELKLSDLFEQERKLSDRMSFACYVGIGNYDGVHVTTLQKLQQQPWISTHVDAIYRGFSVDKVHGLTQKWDYMLNIGKEDYVSIVKEVVLKHETSLQRRLERKQK